MMSWEGCGKKRSWPILTYYPEICQEGLWKIAKDLSRDNQSPGRDLNPVPLKYEAGPRRLVLREIL
jgi:hypothetical protein